MWNRIRNRRRRRPFFFFFFFFVIFHDFETTKTGDQVKEKRQNDGELKKQNKIKASKKIR